MEKKPTQIVPGASGQKEVEEDKCSCEDKTDKTTKLREIEVQAQIHFEDSLHNLLYIKRPSQSRRKRDVVSVFSDLVHSPLEPPEPGDDDYHSTPHRLVKLSAFHSLMLGMSRIILDFCLHERCHSDIKDLCMSELSALFPDCTI